MQTFTVKVTGRKLTAQEVKQAIWQMTDLANEEILVTEEQ